VNTFAMISVMKGTVKMRPTAMVYLMEHTVINRVQGTSRTFNPISFAQAVMKRHVVNIKGWKRNQQLKRSVTPML
jgi:hypothetical protein